MVPRKRVDVGGNARDFEFTEDGWVGLIGDVNHPQRVNLFKGHDVSAVAVETCAPDALAWRNAVHAARLSENLLPRVNIN